MTSREAILQRIRAVETEKIPEPELSVFETGEADESFFKQALVMAGAGVIEIERGKLADYIKSLFQSGRIITSDDVFIDGFEQISGLKSAVKSASFTAGVIQAEFGVAENGALWIAPASLNVPVFPFIAEHLIILLEHGAICSNMHQAYERISLRSAPFGLFIAGPSKTADIEQSLVIGAHGPLSLTILIMTDLGA